MGNSHSSYQNLEPKPLISQVENSWDGGEEWARFLETTWSEVYAPEASEDKNATYKQKIVIVQGSESRKIYHIPKDALVTALGNARETSKFVNKSKKYELFCRWQSGYSRDQHGKLRDSCWAQVIPESESRQMLRKIAAL